MKLSQRKLALIEKLSVLGGIFLVVFVIGYYNGYFRENCGEDKACFEKALQRCKSAEYLAVRHNTVYSYVSYPRVGDTCTLKITLKRVVVGATSEFKELEGSSMKCRIPQEDLERVKLEEMQDLLKMCSGKLKEGLYEIIIQRMYSLVISQMGDIIREAEKVLEE